LPQRHGPVGFSLENFDALGRWRATEEGQPVDVSGGLPDGSQFTGVAGLETAILKRPDVFVTTLTEKLLTFALGRESNITMARRAPGRALGQSRRLSLLQPDHRHRHQHAISNEDQPSIASGGRKRA